MKTRLPSLKLGESGTLVLRLPRDWPESDGGIAWWWGAGVKAAQHGVVERLSDLPPFTRGARVQVWSPATDTLLARVTLPTRTRAKILQALPFALEDQVLGEPESQSYSYRPQADGSLAVAVSERRRLQAWTGALQAAGCHAACLCPATLKVPYNEGHWSLAVEDGEGILRTGPMAGLACALSADGSVPMTLSIALREARDAEHSPVGLVVYNPPAGLDAAAWSEALQLPVETRALDYWAESPTSPPPINLLEREFAGKGGDSLPLAKLRPAAIMLAIWMLVGFGFNLWEWWQLKHTHKAQQTEMLALFKNSFPNAKLVGEPAPLMARQLAALQSGSGSLAPGDLLPLLASAAPALQSSPQVRLRMLQYAESSLTLDLTLADFQGMETLKNALSAYGLQAEVLSANNREGAVDGRLKLMAGGRP